ncbi:Signal transduction histidine kinase [Ruegeria halocynthiae]|uniref:Signal transduction histidine-protein kinase/phosphatase MprB n=1 Tax=Ruegeria halocynthiae TaxID=985054 RepID=A0A1H2Y7U1_9RHOB|nr:HAMP domain-containing sensor histidine kinase [Ruegeria halocynthiae]SDX01272.1 Signal transduction histidine kinase [Ruegeria halocynthiae]
MAGLRRKWRPSLGFVLGGGLVGTLVLSLLGLIALRYLGPEIGFRNAAGLLAVLIGCATAVLGYLMVRLLLRPISALAAYSGAVELGHPAEPPDHFGTQELSRLAGSVLSMADTLQRREASIRVFSDHVTHELKTPVTAIRAAGELLAEGNALTDQDCMLLQQILGASDQMQTQLGTLNSVAKARVPEHHGAATLNNLTDEMRASCPKLDLIIEGGDQTLPLAASGLRIVVRQLLDNAHRHGAGQVALIAKPGRLVIQDDGPGISDGNRDRVFNPFFTTAREEGGTGMGLTIVANLLSAHGGHIALIPSDTGACFEIVFPMG